LNGLTLAYIGDAYYELEIRRYLIDKGYNQVKFLHNKAIKYTSGLAQARIIEYLLKNECLNEEEINAFKRGRNNSSSGRKNLDAKTYVVATGFESLIGYLYLSKKQDRLDEIVKMAIAIIEEDNNG